MAKRWYKIPIGSFCFKVGDMAEIVGVKVSGSQWEIESTTGVCATIFPKPYSNWVEVTGKTRKTGYKLENDSKGEADKSDKINKSINGTTGAAAKRIRAIIDASGVFSSEDYPVDDNDLVNHPKHYTSYPGIEVIQLTEHMSFCRGNAVKYIARAAFKGTELEDLRKAQWYINKEIERLTK